MENLLLRSIFEIGARQDFRDSRFQARRNVTKNALLTALWTEHTTIYRLEITSMVWKFGSERGQVSTTGCHPYFRFTSVLTACHCSRLPSSLGRLWTIVEYGEDTDTV